MPSDQPPIGEVTHFYNKASVAIIKLSAPLKVGDTIRVEGHTTNFEQPVESMQLNHQDITEAKKGNDVGVKVAERVREGDKVFKA